MQTAAKPPRIFNLDPKPHIMIVQARYYDDIADLQMQGVLKVLQANGATHEHVMVPGALEIPAAITYALKSLDFDAMRRRFDGYIALGCVLKGETLHDHVVGSESARGLQDLAMRYALAIGNGILTCNTREQATERADPARLNRSGEAAEACLAMIELKGHFRLTNAKRRWVPGRP